MLRMYTKETFLAPAIFFMTGNEWNIVQIFEVINAIEFQSGNLKENEGKQFIPVTIIPGWRGKCNPKMIRGPKTSRTSQ
jgi:hypothetical protein